MLLINEISFSDHSHPGLEMICLDIDALTFKAELPWICLSLQETCHVSLLVNLPLQTIWHLVTHLFQFLHNIFYFDCVLVSLKKKLSAARRSRWRQLLYWGNGSIFNIPSVNDVDFLLWTLLMFVKLCMHRIILLFYGRNFEVICQCIHEKSIAEDW